MGQEKIQWDEFDEEIRITPDQVFVDQNLLKIGFLYDHPFGARVINNLINKQDFCNKCGPLCINCRVIYPWFSSKIYYVHRVNRKKYLDIEKCWDDIEENLTDLDILIVIGLSKDIIMDIPELVFDFKIKAVILPIENPEWLSPQDQIQLKSKFSEYKVETAFPRPFCSLNPIDFQEESFIYKFIHQFRIGYPKVEFSTKNSRIIKTKVIRSAPCGATYYITQYLRNEQFNTWNSASIEKRISDSLRLYPCMASKLRDKVIEMSTRVRAELINQESIEKALKKANDIL